MTVFADRVEFKLPETWKAFSSKADMCGEGHRRGLAPGEASRHLECEFCLAGSRFALLCGRLTHRAEDSGL